MASVSITQILIFFLVFSTTHSFSRARPFGFGGAQYSYNHEVELKNMTTLLEVLKGVVPPSGQSPCTNDPNNHPPGAVCPNPPGRH